MATVEKKEKKVETVNFKKEALQIIAIGSDPGYIANNFGMLPKSGMAYDHFQIDPDHGKKKKARDAKNLEVEIESKIIRDPKGRVCILARHIMDAIVDANAIAADNGGVVISKKFLRNVIRIEGVEFKDYCPISFTKKNYRSRLDNVVQITGKGARVSNICFRPEFKNWSIRFNVIYLPNSISDKNVLNLLAYCSQFVGLGAWTPSKSGNFGLFTVKTCPFQRKETVKQEKLDSKLIQTGFKQFLKEEGAGSAADLIVKFKPIISKAA